MPTCTGGLETAAAACVGYGWYRWRGSRVQHRRQQFATIGRVCRKLLGTDLGQGHSKTRVDSAIPIGADPSARAAIKAIQGYQDMRKPPADLSMPNCGAAAVAMYFGGCDRTHAASAVDVQTAICEELKARLLIAAAGSSSQHEVDTLAELCRQILMRPEMFTDDCSFLSLMATVSDHLDTLSERLAGTMRTCAAEISNVLSLGCELVDCTIPVLLLSILDHGVGSLPHISGEMLASSFREWQNIGNGSVPSSNVFNDLWATGPGGILQEFVSSRHFLALWDPERAGEGTAHGRLCDGIKWLELFHTWADASDGNASFANSGLLELFRNMDSRDVLQNYMNLMKHLDNFVMFLSMFLHYKSLANIAGDAGMHALRIGLQHLLQELEYAMVLVHQHVLRLTDQTMHKVMELMLADSNPSGRTRLWIERLQHVDVTAFTKIHHALLEAVQQLRSLSAVSRLPALQNSCRRSLEQLSDTTQSEEFRSRCAHLPPTGMLPALAAPDISDNQGVMVTEVTSPVPSSIGNEPVVVDVIDPWEVGLKQRLDPVESMHLQTVGQSWALPKNVDSVSNAVRGLNQGAIQCDEDFCIIRSSSQREAGYYILWKTSTHECAAVEALKSALEVGRATMPAVGEVGDGEEATSTPLVSKEDEKEEEEEEKGAVVHVGKQVEDTTVPIRPVDEVEDAQYYETLIGAVCPLFGGSEPDKLSYESASALLSRGGVPEKTLSWIVDTEKTERHVAIDKLALQRMGRLVAHAQAGCTNLEKTRGVAPGRLPVLRGLEWDPRRRKVLVTESF